MESSGGRTKAGGNAALVAGLVVVIVIALALGAYVFLRAGGLQPPTPIGEIKSDLRKWDQQPVTIEGTVEAPLNIMGLKAYRLKDDSGEIMVVTERGLPSEGTTARVEGYVKQMFKVAGIEQTIIYEPAGETE